MFAEIWRAGKADSEALPAFCLALYWVVNPDDDARLRDRRVLQHRIRLRF